MFPFWILLELRMIEVVGQLELEDVQSCRQIATTNKPTSSFFTGRMPFLLPNQKCESAEGRVCVCVIHCCCMLYVVCLTWAESTTVTIPTLHAHFRSTAGLRRSRSWSMRLCWKLTELCLTPASQVHSATPILSSFCVFIQLVCCSTFHCGKVFIPSVLWYCWLGDRKGIRPAKKLGVGLLVVKLWR